VLIILLLVLLVFFFAVAGSVIISLVGEARFSPAEARAGVDAGSSMFTSAGVDGALMSVFPSIRASSHISTLKYFISKLVQFGGPLSGPEFTQYFIYWVGSVSNRTRVL